MSSAKIGMNRLLRWKLRSTLRTNRLKQLLEGGSRNTLLLLDLRVSPQYAQSRIKGALNLCIPTTLLKRATYNLPKLEQTFQSNTDREEFTKWRETTHLVVYDSFSQDKRDAVSGMNMIKKFTSEGYMGETFLLRGGFNDFATKCPGLIDSSATGLAKPGLSLSGTNKGSSLGLGKADAGAPGVAPVIGGVVLPQASNNSNPFFSNIRQNQDLVDGVGQIEVGVPQGLDAESLPLWLRQVAASDDKGKRVADKFLRIELKEQSRMKAAYSMFSHAVPARLDAATDDFQKTVQLSGIEKGGKNRYKDILPFEHARVKLQGREQGSCDYVNASHVRVGGSHKRYIASQGPLPATFEDFWSVIWDQDVRVIVMLTAESEGGQLKCHPYWQGREFGSLKLRTLSEKKVSLDMDKYRPPATVSEVTPSPVSTTAATGMPATAYNDPFSWAVGSTAETGRRRANTTTRLDGAPNSASGQPPPQETSFVVIRKFALSHAAHPFAAMREITHLHYSSWPDFGAPAQPSHLLALVELANVMQRTAAGSAPSSSQQQQQRKPSGHVSTEFSNPAIPHSDQTARRRSWGRDLLVEFGWHDAPERDVRPRPMLVHCSAGCGRTGTFCTVDSVIDMLKRQSLKAARRADRRRRRMARDDEGHDQHQVTEQPEKKRQKSVDGEGDAHMAGVDAYAMPQQSSPLQQTRPSPSPTPTDVDAARGSGGGSSGSDDVAKRRTSSSSSSSSSNNSEEEERALDTSWLADESVDLIARAVEEFREQRLSMVQSLRQYVLCYETVLEWIARLHERQGGGRGGDERLRTRPGSMVDD
ncbi:hypothetical protein P8C59_000032 [Phyllachora maydis]|uniref:protein-tyrosine-phosphatase n=1 Tax=Phyllachora maydis TaxID=1825666 RepID=A0AAD9M6Y1_9PEZI|nr:hypothetical protein P8C59_000032 [Phyllachora maydis]